MEKIKPNARQLRFLDWEFGVFFHFGIRAFFKGSTDWDETPMPASAFNPTEIDCGSWIKEVKAAGAKYAILTTKHHDGFANWPTSQSEYSVKNSPYKDGKGDIVREFTDACRAYDIKAGLYYSIAQWGGEENDMTDAQYNDYISAQLTELLTNYGKIDYLWFDGCGSDRRTYSPQRVSETIRACAPDIAVFGMAPDDTTWVGNEDGYAPSPNSYIKEGRFVPRECDCKIRSTWFDCEDNEDMVKSVNELIGMYEYSVGRGANLLLNLGPNRRGLLNPSDVSRLREFSAEINRRYGTPLNFCSPFHHKDFPADLCIRLPHSNTLVNRVVLTEDIAGGESVRDFKIYAHVPAEDDGRICVYRGATIGHKAICAFPTVRTARLYLEIISSDGEPKILDIKAYCV